MLNAALNITEKSITNTLPFPHKFRFEQMTSSEDTFEFDEITDKADKSIHKGMDSFPLETFNRMIEYSLNTGNFRNTMLMVCMANWGMRYSDLVRVRYGHIFDRNGNLKESFSLPNGEKKTKKSVVYYNNKAAELVIELYLKQPINKSKSRLDYLFTSDSGNSVKASIQQVEAADLYDGKIETTRKSLAKFPEMEKRIFKKYAEGKVNDKLFNSMLEKITAEKSKFERQLEDLLEQKKNYVSKTPNADKIFIQKPLTHTAGEDIIKNTLKEIGINPRNVKGSVNTNNKYNTHSLRKTFANCFIKVGDKLADDGILIFNETVLNLLKEKFKHSSKSVTTHYTNAQEDAFKTICLNLNIGLEILQNYIASGNNL